MDLLIVMIWVVAWIAGTLLGGALFGLIPFLAGKYMGKPNLGMLGFKWTMASALLGLFFPVAIGFLIAIIVKNTDYYPPVAVTPTPVYQPVQSPAPVVMNTHLGISCLTGPMKGQTYRVGPNGMIIGRDHDCGIRFASNTPGISRHHCALRWQNGVLMLSDLGSAYGTFLADGRKLPPQYPTQLAAGSRFYLGNASYQFQVVITG